MAETITLELISLHRAGTVPAFCSNRAVHKRPKFTAKAQSSPSPRTRHEAPGADPPIANRKNAGTVPAFCKKDHPNWPSRHLIPEGSKPLAGGKRSATTGGSRRDSRRRWSVGAGSHSTFDSATESAVDDGNPTAFPSPTARGLSPSFAQAPYRQIGQAISVPNSPQRRKVRQAQEPEKKLLVRFHLLQIEKTRGLSPRFFYLLLGCISQNAGYSQSPMQFRRPSNWQELQKLIMFSELQMLATRHSNPS
jgi:hypothetical protein